MTRKKKQKTPKSNMFLKSGQTGDYTFLITGDTKSDVSLQIFEKHKDTIIEKADNISLIAAENCVNRYNITKNEEDWGDI